LRKDICIDFSLDRPRSPLLFSANDDCYVGCFAAGPEEVASVWRLMNN
jgi:hypothetical protein